MATITYEDIVKGQNREQTLAIGIPVLKTLGFPADTWGDTDEPNATIQFEAEVLADATETIADIGRLAVLRASKGDACTLHAKDAYLEDRRGAVTTKGTCSLADATGVEQNFAAQELAIGSSADPDLIYRNDVAVTVPASGSVSGVALSAEQPGAKYNVAGTTLQLAAPHPGLSISAAAGSAWLTQSGADEENDESLITRCELKWGTVPVDGTDGATAGPNDAYKKWALDASSQVNRVRVVENISAVYPDPAVSIYLASAAGLAPASAVTAVDAVIQPRRPTGTLVSVASVAAVVFDLLGNVGVKAAHLASAQTKIATLLTQWFSGTAIELRSDDVLPGLDIGERIRVVQLIEIIMSVPGVVYVDLLKPDNSRRVPHVDDVTPLANEVSSLNNGLVYVVV